MKYILLALCLAFALPGCSPLSPRQEIDNQNGIIEDLQNNQNGLMLEILKQKQQLEVQAEEIGLLQQGNFNNANNNSGVQIFSGSGGLIFAFSLAGLGLMFLIYYRNKAVRHEAAAQVLADEITSRNDIDLENSVFLEAMNKKVEKEVYVLMVKGQTKAGRA